MCNTLSIQFKKIIQGISLDNIYIWYLLIAMSTPPSITHYHRCPNLRCGAIWEHAETCFDNQEAHKCPRCKFVQFWVYNKYDTELPTYTQMCAGPDNQDVQTSILL